MSPMVRYGANFTLTSLLETTLHQTALRPLSDIGSRKCTLVQALRLCTGRTAYKGSRGIALPFHDHGTRRVEGSLAFVTIGN